MRCLADRTKSGRYSSQSPILLRSLLPPKKRCGVHPVTSQYLENQVYEEMQSPAEREASTRVTQASDQRTFNLDLLWRRKPGSRAENQKKQATGCWRIS